MAVSHCLNVNVPKKKSEQKTQSNCMVPCISSNRTNEISGQFHEKQKKKKRSKAVYVYLNFVKILDREVNLRFMLIIVERLKDEKR